MAAPLYESHTRTVSPDQVPDPLGAALRDHVARASLSLEGARAWLTHRENPVADGVMARMLGRRSNAADPDPHHDIALVLLSTHLIVGTHGPVRGVSVVSLPLIQATVSRGPMGSALLGGAKLDVPADDGLTILGFPGVEGRPGSLFAGLGRGPDAEACVEAVGTAVEGAKTAG